MDVTTLSLDPEPLASVRWEPCVAGTADGDGGLCAGCGWPLEDHLEAPAA